MGGVDTALPLLALRILVTIYWSRLLGIAVLVSTSAFIASNTASEFIGVLEVLPKPVSEELDARGIFIPGIFDESAKRVLIDVLASNTGVVESELRDMFLSGYILGSASIAINLTPILYGMAASLALDMLTPGSTLQLLATLGRRWALLVRASVNLSLALLFAIANTAPYALLGPSEGYRLEVFAGFLALFIAMGGFFTLSHALTGLSFAAAILGVVIFVSLSLIDPSDVASITPLSFPLEGWEGSQRVLAIYVLAGAVAWLASYIIEYRREV